MSTPSQQLESPPLRLFIVREKDEPDVLVYAHAVTFDAGILIFQMATVDHEAQTIMLQITRGFKHYHDFEQVPLPKISGNAH